VHDRVSGRFSVAKTKSAMGLHGIAHFHAVGHSRCSIAARTGGGNFKRPEFSPLAMVGQSFLFNLHGPLVDLDFHGSRLRACTKEINFKYPRCIVKFLAGFRFCSVHNRFGPDCLPIYTSMD